MFEVTEYTVEHMKDPFGILSGERFEFILDLNVEEDDELYLEEGVSLRVIYLIEQDQQARIVKYEFLNRSTNQYLDFELENDELEWLASFCNDCMASPDAQ